MSKYIITALQIHYWEKNMNYFSKSQNSLSNLLLEFTEKNMQNGLCLFLRDHSFCEFIQNKYKKRTPSYKFEEKKNASYFYPTFSGLYSTSVSVILKKEILKTFKFRYNLMVKYYSIFYGKSHSDVLDEIKYISSKINIWEQGINLFKKNYKTKKNINLDIFEERSMSNGICWFLKKNHSDISVSFLDELMHFFKKRYTSSSFNPAKKYSDYIYPTVYGIYGIFGSHIPTHLMYKKVLKTLEFRRKAMKVIFKKLYGISYSNFKKSL